MISRSRTFNLKVRAIIDPVIQRNGYFSHPKNWLLAMLSDDRPHVRELALSRINIIRVNSEKAQSEVCIFAVPVINFTANEYFEMVNWNGPGITAPLVLNDFSSSHLSDILRNNTDELEN